MVALYYRDQFSLLTSSLLACLLLTYWLFISIYKAHIRMTIFYIPYPIPKLIYIYIILYNHAFSLNIIGLSHYALRLYCTAETTQPSLLWLASFLSGKHITHSLQTLIDFSKTAYLIAFIPYWFFRISVYGCQLLSCMIVHICLLHAA